MLCGEDRGGIGLEGVVEGKWSKENRWKADQERGRKKTKGGDEGQKGGKKRARQAQKP